MENDNKVKEYESILRSSLKEIEILRSKVSTQSEPIAIIGMSCRFPGNSNTPEEYWELIANNRDAITEIPTDRWNIDDYYDPNPEVPGKIYLRNGGFISQKINEFDSKLFNISPTEAIDLDPQQRLLLELSWEAFENANYDVSRLVGSKTGVFIGIATPDYINLIGDKKRYDNTKVTPYSITGTINCMASGRISHYFGLHGPAISLDTACSSSLVATHLACDSIRRGECEMALAGGINLNLSPVPFIGLCRMRALSTDGHCKTFDARGDGYGRSEGGGIILLKSLSAACKDGDRVLAIIRGSAINEDGPSSGLTVPNGNAQELLLRQALSNASLLPADINYLEAHGTGTALGDPIEMHSVANVLGKNRAPENPLFLGAVKSNIGHTESAAGVAGIIKAVLCLQNKKIPAMKIEKLNPRINLERIPAVIPDTLLNWDLKSGNRNVGISAFGLSGTNAHIILSESPDVEKTVKAANGASVMLALSAKTDEALNALIKKYCQYIDDAKFELADIAYTANLCRKHFPSPYRVIFTANSKASLKQKLLDYLNGKREALICDDTRLESIARSYQEGAEIDWKDFYREQHYNKVTLPNYPFQRKSYWLELDSNQYLVSSQFQDESPPLQGLSLPSTTQEHLFIFKISLKNLPEVLDVARSVHIGFSQEMLLNALAQIESVQAYKVEDMAFLLPLLIDKGEVRSVVISLLKENDGLYRFKFQSYQKVTNKWSLHIQGSIRIENAKKEIHEVDGDFNKDAIKQECPTFETKSFYKMLDDREMFLGPSVRLVDSVWVKGSGLVAKFLLRPAGASEKKYTIPLDPAVFDTCAQLFHAVLPEYTAPDLKMMVLKLGKLSVNLHLDFNELWCHFRFIEKDTHTKDVYIGEFYLLNENGECIAECHDFRMKGVTDAALKSLENALSQGVGVVSGQNTVRQELLKLPTAEIKIFITELIKAELAAILTIPKEEILLQESINNLGMDSIMGITFKNAMMQKLSVDIPLEEIVLGPTPEKLITLVLDLVSSNRMDVDPPIITTTDSSTQSRWFVGEIKPHAKYRLFCFPYGGGGASIYRKWQNLFSESIDVCPIQLPGRESRIAEPSYTDINKLIIDLTEIILPRLDIPFAFIGHSFGALVAYCLAMNLSSNLEKVPSHLFVSAFSSPSIPNSRLKRLSEHPVLAKIMASYSPMELLSEEMSAIIQSAIFPESASISREMLPLYLKIAMSDIKVIESYQHIERKLDCDIVAFFGSKDKDVPEADMLAWQALTSKRFHLNKIIGNHLFINDEIARAEMITIIESILNGGN